MRALKLFSGPAVEPVTLGEAKAHCRVDHDDDDDLIDSLIVAARSHLDGQGGILDRALVYQTYDLFLDRFEPCIEIPLPPLVEIVEIEYSDETGALQTLSSSAWQVIAGGLFHSKLLPAVDTSWPSVQDRPHAVRIRFTCGYVDGDASPVDLTAIPEPIRHAILMMVAHWYENREAIVVGANAETLPMAAGTLLAPWRAAHV